MQKLMGLVRRCVEDYQMIASGDRVAVGVSGGKDSLVLLQLLAGLRQYSDFELEAILQRRFKSIPIHDRPMTLRGFIVKELMEMLKDVDL